MIGFLNFFCNILPIFEKHKELNVRHTYTLKVFWDKGLNGTVAPADVWVDGSNDKVLQGYFNFMIEVAVLLGADETNAKDELKKVMEFENSLANIQMSLKDSMDPEKAYKPKQLKGFQNNDDFPSSWTSYVQKLYQYDEKDLEIKDDEIVINGDTKFYKELGPILKNTTKRTLFNYIGWRVAKDALDYLTPEARKISQKFNKLITGVEANTPRWQECIGEVGFNRGKNGKFNAAVSSMYARFIYSPAGKDEVIDMTDYLRKAFAKILDETKWMDSETKKEAVKKLANMKQFMAYPKELLEKDKVDGFYKELKIDDGKYFENAHKIARHLRKHSDLKLREVVVAEEMLHGEWGGWSVALVNAYYDPFSNSIKFPAGYLQGMLYLIGNISSG